MILFHLTTRGAWDAAKLAGVYEPPSLASEGFIHLSTRAQWLAVLDRFYRDVSDQLLLTIDGEALGAPLSHEAPRDAIAAARPFGIVATFLQLHGPIDVATVARFVELD